MPSPSYRRPDLLGWLLLSLGLVAVQAGCDLSASASFVPNMSRMQTLVEAEQDELKDAQDKSAVAQRHALLRRNVVEITEALFGTPDAPHVTPEMGLNEVQLKMAAGPTVSAKPGTTTGGLYRRHCVHCHGVSGDGKGPTAAFLNPYPRDFRHGEYKFKSNGLGEKPTNDDLKRTLVNGIPGTAMPSFKLLTTNELDALVEYVKYLSLRGEFEAGLIEAAGAKGADESLWDPKKAKESRDALLEVLTQRADKWKNAASGVFSPPARKPLSPAELQASIDAGRKLFYGRGNCFSCHGDSALGDGQKYVINEPAGKIGNIDNKLTNWTLPPMEYRPRNIRLGVFRGGHRPIDLYRRIHFGINQTPMPAVPRGGPGLQSDDEMWNLVDFLLFAAYETPTPREREPENMRVRN